MYIFLEGYHKIHSPATLSANISFHVVTQVLFPSHFHAVTAVLTAKAEPTKGAVSTMV